MGFAIRSDAPVTGIPSAYHGVGQGLGRGDGRVERPGASEVDDGGEEDYSVHGGVRREVVTCSPASSQHRTEPQA